MPITSVDFCYLKKEKNCLVKILTNIKYLYIIILFLKKFLFI